MPPSDDTKGVFPALSLSRIVGSATAWGMLAIGLRAGSSLLVLPLALQRMPSSELGIWYIFLGILGTVPLLDMGITPTVGRRLAQLFAGGGPEAEITHFLSTVRAWYRWMGLFSWVFLLLCGGAWIWIKSAELPDRQHIVWAWLLFCPTFALTVGTSFWRTIFFGINAVLPGQRITAAAQAVQLGVAFYGILSGWGLFALVLGNVSTTAVWVAASWWWSKGNPILMRHWAPSPRLDPAVFRDLWRISWRVVVNMGGGYLAAGTGVLIGSAFLDLGTVASYGLSLQALTFASQVSSLWMDVKQPLFAGLYEEDRPRLRRLFFVRLRFVLGSFLILVLGLIVCGPALLAAIHAKTFFLPFLPLLTLSLFIGLCLQQGQFESFCLCLNHNPFPGPLLVSGFLSALGAAGAVHLWGVWGLILAPLAIQGAFLLWWIPAEGLRKLGLRPSSYWRSLFLARPGS